MQKILGRPSADVHKILFSLTRGYEELLQTSRLGEWETKRKKDFEPGLVHIKRQIFKNEFP